RFQSVAELQNAIVGQAPPQRIRSIWKAAPRPTFGLATIAAILIVVAFVMLGLRAPKPVVDSTASDAEFAAFHMAESLNTEDAWNTFLKNYRKGELVWVARQRAEALRLRDQKRAKNTSAASNAGPAVPAELTKSPESAPRLRWAALVDSVVIPGGVFTMGD